MGTFRCAITAFSLCLNVRLLFIQNGMQNHARIFINIFANELNAFLVSDAHTKKAKPERIAYAQQKETFD